MTQITLYAQPRRDYPLLNIDALRRGVYQESPKDESKNAIFFTDIGLAAWKTACQHDVNASIVLQKVEDPQANWEVSILTDRVTIALKGKKYKLKGKRIDKARQVISAPVANNLLIGLNFNGDYYSIVKFVQDFRGLIEGDPYEMNDWEEFTARTAISRIDAIENWNTILNKDVEAEVSQEVLTAQTMITSARELGVDVTEAEKLFSYVKDYMERGEYSVAVDYAKIALAVAEEAKRRREELAAEHKKALDAIIKLQQQITDAKNAGINTNQADAIFNKIKSAQESGDYSAVMELISSATKAIKTAEYEYNQATNAIRSLQWLITDTKNLGVNVTKAEELFKLIEREFRQKNYEKVLQYSDQTRAEIDAAKEMHKRMLSQYQHAYHATLTAQSIIVDAKRMGADVKDADELLKSAKTSMSMNDYKSAIEYAERAYELASSAYKLNKAASDTIQALQLLLTDAKRALDTTKIEGTIAAAQTALNSGDYENAIAIAERCKTELSQMLNESRPKLTISFIDKRLQTGVWNRCKLNIENVGTAHAKNIELKFTGKIECMQLQHIPDLRAGDMRTIEVGLKTDDGGEMPLELIIAYERVHDSFKYQARGVKWLKFDRGPPPGIPVEIPEVVWEREKVIEVEPKIKIKRPEADEIKKLASELRESLTYLLKDESPARSFKIFAQRINMGQKGLCVTRSYPKRVYEMYDIGKTKVIWLTNVGGEGTIRPTNLEKLGHIIKQFIRKSGRGILLLDGLEYLITHNKYESILKFVQSLHDEIAINKCMMLIPVSPVAIGQHELKLLEREVDETI
jgi:tetratricopeptide (TPR) repeat protein